MYLQKYSNQQKKKKKKFFVVVLKVNDENSRIPSQIRINWSETRIHVSGPGSGSLPKYHGSATLVPVLSIRHEVWFSTDTVLSTNMKLNTQGPSRLLTLKQHALFLQQNQLSMYGKNANAPECYL
jgi:hypothetical protein